MVWVCVDGKGNELIFSEKPKRQVTKYGSGINATYIKEWQCDGVGIRLPKGTIFRLVGKKMSWKSKAEKLNNYFYE